MNHDRPSRSEPGCSCHRLTCSTVCPPRRRPVGACEKAAVATEAQARSGCQFTSRLLLNDPALERDAVGPVLCHGCRSFEFPVHPVKSFQSVCPTQEPTPNSAMIPAFVDSGNIRPPFAPVAAAIEAPTVPAVLSHAVRSCACAPRERDQAPPPEFHTAVHCTDKFARTRAQFGQNSLLARLPVATE